MIIRKIVQAQDIGGRIRSLQDELVAARARGDRDAVKEISRSIKELISLDVRGERPPRGEPGPRPLGARQIGDSNPSRSNGTLTQ